MKRTDISLNILEEFNCSSLFDIGKSCVTGISILKARVDPVLYSHLCLMILRVNSEFPGQGLVSILHLGIMRLPLE